MTRWLLCALALTACGPSPSLAGLWLHEEPITGGATKLRVWKLGGDAVWQQLESSGEWPLTPVTTGTWKRQGDELVATTADAQIAWRTLSVTDRTLDVEDVTAFTGHRLFVRAQTCPLPRSPVSWYRWQVVDDTGARPNIAFDVSSGAPIAFVAGELLEEDSTHCSVVHTPVGLAQLDGLARLADGSTALWFTDQGVLTGALFTEGVLSARTPLSKSALMVTAARGADGSTQVAWLERDVIGVWRFVIAAPATAWSTTRAELPFATPSGAALVTSEDGRRWTVLAGAGPSGERSTTVIDDAGALTGIVGVALRPPYVVNAAGTLFAMNDTTLVRIQNGVMAELGQGLYLAAGIRHDGTVLGVRRVSTTIVQLDEWLPAHDKPVGTPMPWVNLPGWTMAVGESRDGRLHLFGSDVVWMFRDPKARPGAK